MDMLMGFGGRVLIVLLVIYAVIAYNFANEAETAIYFIVWAILIHSLVREYEQEKDQ